VARTSKKARHSAPERDHAWTPVTALRTRLLDTASGFGKAYLNLLLDEIRLDGNDLHVRATIVP